VVALFFIVEFLLFWQRPRAQPGEGHLRTKSIKQWMLL